MKKKNFVIFIACLFIIAAGVLYSCSYNKEGERDVIITSLTDNNNSQEFQNTMRDGTASEEAVNSGGEILSESPELIYVHLCGAVVNPDVYRIEAGSRLVDVIKLAGGLSPDAAGDYINQAMVVEDGQRIYIPTKDELKSLTVSDYIEGDQNNQSKDSEANLKININTADEDTLMSLPGIGQARAQSIIEYRNKNGNFSDIEDLKKVPGIKEGLFSRIADKITVGN